MLTSDDCCYSKISYNHFPRILFGRLDCIITMIHTYRPSRPNSEYIYIYIYIEYLFPLPPVNYKTDTVMIQ